MAVQRKLGKGIQQVHSSITTEKGNTFTEVEKFTGPYGELLILLAAIWQSVKSCSLSPQTGGEGELTITRELVTDKNNLPKTTTLEVVWQETRMPVECHPAFKLMTSAEVDTVKKKAANGIYSGMGDLEHADEAYKLMGLYQRNITEYATGTPVVRRTTSNQRGDLAGGGSWYRNTPPVVPPGDWKWMKTSDDRRREGNSYSQIEEWKGFYDLDETLYPLAP